MSRTQVYNIKSIMKWLILLTLIITITLSVDEGDWVDPFDLPIPFAIRAFYAGYLNVSSTKALYYVYTPSQNNPSKDPLIVLISPGPGCSVLHSWLYSKGEFTFTRNTSNFRHNPYNWNKRANVLYIQGPAGVGFTIGVEQTLSDEKTVSQYFRALFRFYEKFPELKDQKMYLAGFGYAGIVAPKLALAIVENNKSPDTPAWVKMNINGLLMFNPCTYAEQCDSHFLFNHFTVKALRNNFFLNEDEYEDYRTHCTLKTSECVKQQLKIQSKFRQSGADLSNLYMECLHQPGDYGCIDHKGVDAFLNNLDVKKDLNADTTKVWNLCNNTVSQIYERDPDGSLKTYETLLTRERSQNLRIWIVSGTLSARVPTWGTKKWVNEIKGAIGYPNTRLWQNWFYNKKVNAGQIEQIPGLTFLTIRSAGYYMFEDQPEISHHVFDSFLDGVSL